MKTRIRNEFVEKKNEEDKAEEKKVKEKRVKNNGEEFKRIRMGQE